MRNKAEQPSMPERKTKGEVKEPQELEPQAEKKIISIEKEKGKRVREKQEFFRKAEDFAVQKEIECKMQESQEREQFNQQRIESAKVKIGAAEQKVVPEAEEQGVGQKFKNGLRKIRFKLSGVKNPKQMVGLVNYLENNVVEGHPRRITDKKGETKEFYKHYEFSVRNLETLKQLVDLENDPAEVISKLQKAGLDINVWDVINGHIASLQELIDTPHAAENIEILRNANVNFRTTNIKSKEQIQDWQAVISDETLKQTLTPEVQENLLQLSTTLNERIDPSNLKEYVALAQNRDTCQFIEALSGPDGVWEKIRRQRVGLVDSDYDLAYKLKLLQDKGLIAKMLPLAGAGFDLHEFTSLIRGNLSENVYQKRARGTTPKEHKKLKEKRGNWRRNYLEKDIKKLEEKLEDPGTQKLLKNKEFRNYVYTVSTLTGEKVKPNTLWLLERARNDKNFIPALCLLNKYEGKANLVKAENLCHNRLTLDKLFSKNFQNFADSLTNRFPDKPMFFDNSVANVLELYENEKTRKTLLGLDQAGWDLMNFLKQGREGEKNTFTKEMLPLLSEPTILNTLKQLRECYGYYWNGNKADLEYFKKLPRLEDLKTYTKAFDYIGKHPDIKKVLLPLSKNVKFNPWDLAGSAKPITSIPLLEKVNQNKDKVDPAIIAKHTEFYTYPVLVDFMEQNPEKFTDVYWIHQTGLLDQAKLIPVCAKLIGEIIENKKLFDPALLEKYQEFYSDQKVVDFIAQNPEKLIDVYALHQSGILDKTELLPAYIHNLGELLNVPENQREQYIEICERVDQSPSQEMQRIKFELINQLLQTENPLAVYQQIESIFVKNNLPLVGKIYKVFETLYPPEKLKEILQSKRLSPYLTKSKTRRRYYTIYKDLLRVHIESANRNLRDYLNILESGQNVLHAAEQKGIESLNDRETQELRYFLLKVQTLFENSQLGRRTSPEGLSLKSDLLDAYQELETSLGTKENQTVTQRISEMFLKPLGYKGIEEVLMEMKKSKLKAHQRGLKLTEEAKDGYLKLKEGDLLKGVGAKFTTNILQNGNVAKEFLGEAATSDQTPLDTDVSMVLEKESKEGFKSTIDKSLAQKYGNLLFAVKDRGQFQLTTKENVKNYKPAKFELFAAFGGVEEIRHYGVRTGFPATEIDFMVAKDDLIENEKEMEKIYFEIAQNGYYIPVANTEGKVVFTPQQYEKIRAIFKGLDRFDGKPFQFVPNKPTDPNYNEVSLIAKQIAENREQVRELSGQIRQVVKAVLEENGVEIKDEHDTSIVGAELLDTGSTGRETNAIGDFDFDLALRLDEKDVDKVDKIATEIGSRLQPQEDKSHSSGTALYQIRGFGCQAFGKEPIDVDVGLVKKSDLVYFGSHEAVQEKLNWIKDNLGESVHKQIVANVILAKRILKEGSAYKKVEHGGIGGIGVENWILKNNGNMLKAFESFLGNAYDTEGKLLSLKEFKKKYKIIDPGTNVQKFSHDNYIDYLTENGYRNMVKTIESYLGKVKAVEEAVAA